MVDTTNNENILNSVKLALGGGLVSYSDDAFDNQLLLHINSTFLVLNQLGVGPSNLFMADATTSWSDFLVGASTDLNLVKSYMYLRVRLLFDPPSSSFVLDSMKEQIKEFEFRLNVHVDPEIERKDDGGDDTPSGDDDTPVVDVKNVQCVIAASSVRNNGYLATPVVIVVSKTGLYNISWTGWRSTSSGNMGTRLYINGEAQPIINDFANTYGLQATMNNVELVEGDRLTVYASSGSNTYVMWVSNLIIEEIVQE